MNTNFAIVIYRVFYFLLHCVFTKFETLQAFYKSQKNKLCHEFALVNDKKHFGKLGKTPTHLTVLLGGEEPSPKDLANLILWCMAAHITFISFYDYKGSLKKHENELHLVVEKKKAATDHVIWHSHPDGAWKNGYSGRKIHVKVLSENDGKGGVVDLTKKLARTSETDISIESFDAGLREQFEFPDPELAVCCGKTFCLYGYPPWQIRVTEFLNVDSHHNITFNHFVNLLQIYAKCEQRFGK
ncbi:nogo-B receptor [Asbolus verrucosus]|uniref:ditrans,polycis-polyprenyl diphosphate synthase [(2E,6E)-farnesyldiphosphate specific] n=1 Tax=Asbolus verrucosus TaxID=1661398 RepID=A0A482V7P5_ASBVE|nr:nogo-B receptor [Asbolus verrucosus]